MIEAKFLGNSTEFVVHRLTNAGHDFLDLARQDTRWNKAKELVLRTGGTLTVEALKIALRTLMKHVGVG